MNTLLLEKDKFNLINTILVTAFMILASIAIGVLGAGNSGVSYIKFAPNIVGVALGVLLFALVARFRLLVHKHIFVISLVALGCLLSTFSFEGLEGVFRWLKVGPLLIHVSSIVIPVLLYNCYQLEAVNQHKAYIPIIIAFLVFVFQPDAGQSLALLFGMLPLVFRVKKDGVTLCYSAIILLLSTIVWFQPDSLMPVQHVENIFLLISELQHFGDILVVISIACVLSPIAFVGRFKDNLTLSILLYFIGGLVATQLGHFPVPIVGAGTSPVLGMFLALSLIYSKLATAKQSIGRTSALGSDISRTGGK